MAEFSKLIEVDINTVFFDPEDESRSATVDCVSLKEKNIKFVCEQDGIMWIEYKPFTGRIYEFDRVEIDKIFQDAETKWAQENDQMMNSLDVTPEISAYYGMLAIEQMGYLQQFYDWSTSSERTIQQKMYFSYKLTWRRDDSILVDCLTSVGLTEQNIDDVFEMAVNF